jgi:hypothetical protein
MMIMFVDCIYFVRRIKNVRALVGELENYVLIKSLGYFIKNDRLG